MTVSLTAGQSKSLYRSMLRIRRIEEAIADKYQEQEMRCPVHLCIGQEAVSSGVCLALETKDTVYSNHRAHGHYLAKGGDLGRFIAELYGRADGCAGGYGGSMHLMDLDAGFMGCTPIVGGTVPLAVGSAWAHLLKKSRGVSVAFFGDGCFEEGVTHEAMNFATLKKLPVIFVCENNLFSVYTPLKERQPDREIHKVAAAQGWQTWSGDGNDASFVYQTARKAVSLARGGKGPQFLELFTYRWREHCGPNYDDHLSYRSEAEFKRWRERCPIQALEKKLLREKVLSRREIQDAEAQIAAEIKEAFRFALSSSVPLARNMGYNVYAN